MAKFEGEILYEAKFRPLLETYAEALGWRVEGVSSDAFVVFRGEGSHEEDLLRDTLGHIDFFMNEDNPAPPLHYRILRVIYDSVTGYDEISEDGPCPECGVADCKDWGSHGT